MADLATQPGRFGHSNDHLGVDAARWFLLSRSHDTTVDLDLELARRETSENPVYYVQYAHARIESVKRKAGPDAERSTDGSRSECPNRRPSSMRPLNCATGCSAGGCSAPSPPPGGCR